ncbi:MAG: hypothetical protein AAFP20_20780, partial [Cyanobacteria bacterium J06614_10]
HSTGFSPGSRESISAHEVNVTLPLNPVARSGSEMPVINLGRHRHNSALRLILTACLGKL